MRFLKSRYTAPPVADASVVEQQTDTRTVITTSRLDLITARSSLIIEAIGLFLLSLNFPAFAFVLISIMLTLGTGTSPALNSLALALLPDKSSTGRLFGALSVLHALGSSLLSPILFGELFAATVGTYAPTVFGVAASLPAMAIIALSFVRLKREPPPEPRGEDGKLLRRASKGKMRRASTRG
jgi:hypothetical protein